MTNRGSDVVTEDLGRMCLRCFSFLCVCLFVFRSCDRPTSSCVSSFLRSEDVKMCLSLLPASVSQPRFELFFYECLSLYKDGRHQSASKVILTFFLIAPCWWAAVQALMTQSSGFRQDMGLKTKNMKYTFNAYFSFFRIVVDDKALFFF